MTTFQQLSDDIDRLAETALPSKAKQRDFLLAAIFAYFNADSERSQHAACEQMRDAVELATGKRA